MFFSFFSRGGFPPLFLSSLLSSCLDAHTHIHTHTSYKPDIDFLFFYYLSRQLGDWMRTNWIYILHLVGMHYDGVKGDRVGR